MTNLSRRRFLLGASTAAAAAVIKANIPAAPIEVSAYLTEQPAWVPEGWIYPDGRTLTRANYERLFSAIGTTYDRALHFTFRLPDLRDLETPDIGYVMAGEKSASPPGSILMISKRSSLSAKDQLRVYGEKT